MFRRLLIVVGFTNVADGIATVAWTWLASALTRDPLLIAVVPAALRLPWFLFAVPAGIITDRMDRRRLMVVMNLTRSVLFALCAAMILFHQPLDPPPLGAVSEPVLFGFMVIAALLVGSAEVLHDTVAQTIVSSIVPDEQLEAANGHVWSIELTANMLAGPMLGAVLVGAMLALPFMINAACYGLAFALLAGTAVRSAPKSEDVQAWRKDLKAGLDLFLRSPTLISIAWLAAGWNVVFEMTVLALLLTTSARPASASPGPRSRASSCARSRPG